MKLKCESTVIVLNLNEINITKKILMGYILLSEILLWIGQLGNILQRYFHDVILCMAPFIPNSKVLSTYLGGGIGHHYRKSTHYHCVAIDYTA